VLICYNRGLWTAEVRNGSFFEKFLIFSIFYVYTGGSGCVNLRFGKDSKDGESL
jgi:hypothetical protein